MYMKLLSVSVAVAILPGACTVLPGLTGPETQGAAGLLAENSTVHLLGGKDALVLAIVDPPPGDPPPTDPPPDDPVEPPAGPHDPH